jgi:hypothetical protein
VIRRALVVGALALAVPRPAAADLDPRVLILPAEGSGPRRMKDLAADVGDALARGAARTTPTVARADATLADTAVVVGCDPAEPACLDAVAAALNVDQVLFSRLRVDGADAQVDVTAVTREAAPSTRTFRIRAGTRASDLAAIEPAVVEMLASGEARRAAQAEHPVARAPVAAPVAPPPHVGSRWPMMITVSGAVLVAGGLSSWAVAAARQGDIDGAPSATVADLEHLTALEGSARRAATLGNALVIGGGLVTIAGGVLWWRQRGPHAVVVAPQVGGDHASVIVKGTW